MFDKLDFITEKYDELAQKVSDPEIINNQPVWQKHVKEMGEMEPIVKKYKEYKKAKSDLAEAKVMRKCVNWPRWRSPNWKTPSSSRKRI